MFTKKLLFSLLALIGTSLVANAQDKTCGTTKAQKEFLEKNPELAQPISKLNEFLNQVDVSKLEKNRAGNYVIPVVYHVLHNYGAENISDAQIFSDIKVLNARYNKKNGDTIDIIAPFKPLIANVGIEFKLANKDPEGNCTNGIDRIHTYKTTLADDQSKFNSWNRSHYLNIWVAASLKNVVAAAYALPPAYAHFAFYYDGVISRHNYIGDQGTSNYNNSKTTTHEVGHCLNLAHTWGSTNEPAVACGDDGVNDTPETMGHEPGTCAAWLWDSLSPAFVCNPPVLENVQNVMDYSYCDAEMFTWGQRDRMLTSLNDPTAQRNSLFTQQSLFFAGLDGPKMDCAPKADFNTNKQFTCIGTPVSFTNRSYNDTVLGMTHAWDFTADGTPANATTKDASASFATVGWKNITLASTSNAGTGTTVKNNYVYVADPVGKVVTGQINSFEDENIFNTSWANFNYYNNVFKWQYYPWGGYSGTKCIRYRGFDDRIFPANTVGSAKNDMDELITEAYNISGLTAGSAYLNFFVAGATRASINADIDDELTVLYSTNCGTTWTTMVTYTKTAVINNGKIDIEFNADNNAVWMPKSIQLPAGAISSNTFFKLRFKPGDYSNDVYIDNFEINATPAAVKDFNDAGYSFDIVPNPATSFSSIQLNTSESGEVKILVTNILGDKVASFSQNASAGKLNVIDIPANVFSHKGIYVVSMDINGKRSTKKMVIQ